MPKLILRCNYLKNAPSSHLANYINYISTREGVENADSTTAVLPATVKQKQLVDDILSKVRDAGHMHEYYDYLQNPTRENATEFITQALENNLDIIAKKKNYIDYLANRPRVEKIGTHGLFSNEGEAVVLSKVAEEVANHPGVIWTNVISLRREDAERLGYDSAAQWQALLRSRVDLLCRNYKIDVRNLKWYAAFHNESHHPHVHLVLYSANPSEGHLSPEGIDNMRSTYAHDIFRQEFMSIYEKKTEQREQLKEQANESLLFLLREMQTEVCHNPQIAEQMQMLSKRLMNTKGKKVYGYLKADVKAIINGIVDELGKEEKMAECYRKWLESKSELLHYYKDSDAEMIPLSQQKELKSIKNMVIREAVRYGEGYLYTEDEGLDDLETEREETDSQEVYAKWTDTYKEAKEYGNNHAAYQLAKLYIRQETEKIKSEAETEFDYEKIKTAVSCLEQAAEQENSFADYTLGKLYREGRLLAKDMEKAFFHLHRAADRGNGYAQYLLGKVYLTGKDVEQNKETAYEYFKLAAAQGNLYAAYFLEHWNDMGQPDLFLMASRLMHHLGKIIEENVSPGKSGGRQGIDRKLARKIRQKKIAQGHARDDHAEMIQIQ